MQLAAYLKDHEISSADFAERIGVTVQALSRYRLGHRKPEWEILERIRVESGGAVMPNDFLPATNLTRTAEPVRSAVG